MKERAEFVARGYPPARGMYHRGVPIEVYSKPDLERVVAHLESENRRLEAELRRQRRMPWLR